MKPLKQIYEHGEAEKRILESFDGDHEPTIGHTAAVLLVSYIEALKWERDHWKEYYCRTIDEKTKEGFEMVMDWEEERCEEKFREAQEGGLILEGLASGKPIEATPDYWAEKKRKLEK